MSLLWEVLKVLTLKKFECYQIVHAFPSTYSAEVGTAHHLTFHYFPIP